MGGEGRVVGKMSWAMAKNLDPRQKNEKKAQGGSQTSRSSVGRQKNACGLREDRHSWSRFQPVFRR